MKNLFYISLILLLLSCTKGKGNIYAEGRVYNPISGQGISGIEVRLMRTNNPTLAYEGTGLEQKELVVTDGNGNFVIEHIGNLFGTYELRVKDPSGDFKEIGWDETGTENREIKPKEEVYDNYMMIPYGNLSLHTENVNCQGPDDSLHRELTYLFQNETYNNDVFWLGCQNGQGISKWPIGDYRYDWYVIRGGVRTDSSTSFTIVEGQTTHVEVFY
jgi:hypothetical protein